MRAQRVADSARRMDYNQLGLTIVRREASASNVGVDNGSPFLSTDKASCVAKSSFWNKRDVSIDVSLPSSQMYVLYYSQAPMHRFEFQCRALRDRS